MLVSVTFRHMPTSEPLRKYAENKANHLKKIIDDAAEAHVVLSVEHHMHRVDINLNSHGILIRGKEISDDMYNSIDRALEKIEKQVKRYKSRIINHRPKEGARRKFQLKFLHSASLNEEHTHNGHPTIIETKEIDARPMMLEEAVMQMDLLHSDILVFLNTKTEHLNVLYRKKNDKYGLIETSTA